MLKLVFGKKNRQYHILIVLKFYITQRIFIKKLSLKKTNKIDKKIKKAYQRRFKL